ncbi:MAG: hypothetical protein ACREIU_04855, partial [Planctomycetota bacterium]
VPVLAADASAFPLVVAPRKKFSVPFAITFDCAGDPLPSTSGDPDHADFRVVATVHREALGGLDMHPVDDDCPRGPDLLNPIQDPCSGKPIRDKGCGRKAPGGALGADVLIDVVVD